MSRGRSGPALPVADIEAALVLLPGTTGLPATHPDAHLGGPIAEGDRTQSIVSAGTSP